MGRLLRQLSSMSSQKDCKKVKLTEESRKYILWWRTYLDQFNGISMIVNDDPIPLSYKQLLNSPHDICAGDAIPTGGGAWHGKEYWCGDLPDDLKEPQIPIHIKEFWFLSHLPNNGETPGQAGASSSIVTMTAYVIQLYTRNQGTQLCSLSSGNFSMLLW